ncbi:hypothetical protein, partial [Mesorhizobium sp. M7A.F.Ca.CA.004.09.1.2]|uniref:hypothetical protein n=2 Tax=unclassified Mesorhizobium TaxID=325217 RepID=UPI001FDEBA71
LTNLFSRLGAGSARRSGKSQFTGLDKVLVENSRDAARARADLRFKKQEEAATVRQKAMAEYVAESDARQAKTNKLRALRLAKEAEDLANAPAEPAKKPARAKKK